MSLRLYSWPRSSGSRVHWALEELGVPYEYVELDRKKGEHRAPAYLALNPNGKVPALVDGGDTYFESLAILIHLAQTYGGAKGLWPAGAEALSWLVWSVTELHAFMMQYLYHGLDTPVSYAPDQRSKATAEYNGATLQGQLDLLEQRLAGRPYLMGDAFSLVDVSVAASLLVGTSLGLTLGARPALTAWLERCRARPALARAV